MDFTDKLDLLYLISKFDFISYDFLFDIVDENKFYPILEEFLFSSICEKLGSNGDYIRVNDVISPLCLLLGYFRGDFPHGTKGQSQKPFWAKRKNIMDTTPGP